MRFQDIPFGTVVVSKSNRVRGVRMRGEPYRLGNDMLVEIDDRHLIGGRISHENEFHGSDDWELEEVEIHGENVVSLAAIMEYLTEPTHPNHEWAKRKAEKFVETHRKTLRESLANHLPQYDPDTDGDYESWLVANNID